MSTSSPYDRLKRIFPTLTNLPLHGDGGHHHQRHVQFMPRWHDEVEILADVYG